MLNNVNDAQKRAIMHTEGPMLVLAGPGSGKTTVITQRIKYLIEEQKIKPEDILVITFTKAAALEMQQRFFKLTNEKIYPVMFGTFHAIFFQILRHTYKFDAQNIIREYEKINLISEILENLPSELLSDSKNDYSLNNYQNECIQNNRINKNIDLNEEINNYNNTENIQYILSEISRLKNSGLSCDSYQEAVLNKSQFEFIYNDYKKNMKKLRKLDFDDMIVLCRDLLNSRPEVLKMWQDKFKYILIDEFQDINPMQYEVIKLLSKPQDNIFIVGDDDQSIYGFRGASPEIMLGFEKDYTNAKRVLLNINYRSSADIVKHSCNLIGNNKNRFTKEINPQSTDENGVKVYYYADKKIQNENIIQLIKQYLNLPNTKYSDIAIIYRTHNNAAYLLERLSNAKIPFNINEKIKNIYTTPIAKDIISYLKLCTDKNKINDFYRIMNKPSRYIKKYSVPLKEFSINELLCNNKNNEQVSNNILKLFKDINYMKHMTPFAAINYIRKGINYDSYVKEQSKHIKNSKKFINDSFDELDLLQEKASEFLTISEWLEHIEVYTKELENEAKKENDDGINIVTMHAAKGLEWKVVILPDVNENVIPHKRAVTDKEIEEERRLFYVAMTRAKEKLFIFSIKEERADNNLPSRFIGELFD